MQPWRNSEWVRVLLVLDLSSRSMPRLSPTAPSRVSRAVAKALIRSRRSRRVGSPGAEPHAKAQVFRIAEVRLDRPPPRVVVDQLGSRRLGVAGRETPAVLHALGVDADDGADLPALRGHPGLAQLAGAARLADPLGGRPGLAVRVGDVDVAAEADHVAEAELGQEAEQILVAGDQLRMSRRAPI